MRDKRLNWDRVKQETLKSKHGVQNFSEEIDHREESQLQEWWESKRSPTPTNFTQPAPNIKKKKARSKNYGKKIKKSWATHKERLNKWKEKNKTQ